MSSLKDRIELLENDLKAVPSRINVYHDLPFAILRYDPVEEWELRKETKLLATRLETAGKEVHIIPMTEFLWKAIDETEGMNAVVALERERGYWPRRNRSRPTSRIGLASAGDASRRTVGRLRSGQVHRFPYARGGNGSGHLPRIQAARRNARQNSCNHDSVLSRFYRGHYWAAFHGPQRPRRFGQLPSKNLRMKAW